MSYSSDGNNSDIAIARLNEGGSLDTGFNGTGKRLMKIGPGNAADFANAAALQSDGKVVVTGASWNGLNYDITLVRYTATGGLDTTFDTDGMVTTAIGSNWEAGNGVAIEPGGKIVVSGYVSDGTQSDIALLRYNSGGSLDTSFDSDGIVITPIFAFDDSASALVLQADGKMVVAGATLVRSSPVTHYDFALVRYNP